MDAVGDHFHAHVLHEVDRLDRAGVLVLAHVVEAGHGVVEVGGQAVACIIGAFHVVILGSRVPDGSHNALAGDVLAHLDGAGQLGGHIPAAHAVVVFDKVVVLLGVGVAYDFGHLRAGLAGVEVGALQVQSHDGAARLFHELVAGVAGGVHHRGCRRRQGGEDGRSAMLHVGLHRLPEGLLGALHEVAAATAVAVQLDAARHHVQPFGVDGLIGVGVDVAAFSHLGDEAVLDEYRASVDPPLWGEYMSVIDLS